MYINQQTNAFVSNWQVVMTVWHPGKDRGALPLVFMQKLLQ